MNSYVQQLKNPKWQKKRLLIMERDGFVCTECGDNNSTLNVHHRYYIKGNAPWEYPDVALITLCENCHSRRHELNNLISRVIGGLSYRQAAAVLGYASVWPAFNANMFKDYDWNLIGDTDAFVHGITDNIQTIDQDNLRSRSDQHIQNMVDITLSCLGIEQPVEAV